MVEESKQSHLLPDIVSARSSMPDPVLAGNINGDADAYEMGDLNSLIESEVIVKPNQDEDEKEDEMQDPPDEDYGDLALLEEYK